MTQIRYSCTFPEHPDENGRIPTYTAKGQAVVVGNMALTAAHTLPQYDNLHATDISRLVIHEQVVNHTIIRAGVPQGSALMSDIPDATQINSQSFYEKLKHRTFDSWDSIPQDWALIRLDKPVQINGTPIGFDADPIPPGTCLSLIRAPNNGTTYERLDTHTLLALSDEEVPKNLLFLARPKSFDGHGWSGCFVGRQSADGRWDLVGISVSEVDPNEIPDRETGYLIVVRPPREVLEQLIAAGRTGDTQSPQPTPAQ
ncbi:MAG TPA: hypothetical protein ENJ00_02725 [Phycisphaerales bacterium]|nr:hypothetical protein [Phycisphaerales bacterium]